MTNLPGDSLISGTDPLGYLGTFDHAEVNRGADSGAPGNAAADFDLQRLLSLWDGPLPAGNAAEAAMRAVYTDPVVINGARTTIAALVANARSLAGALENQSREIIDYVEAGQKVVVAFRLRGTHTGPLATSAGLLPASGQDLSIRIIDILTLSDGLITEVVMVADELGALSTIGAVALGQTTDS